MSAMMIAENAMTPTTMMATSPLDSPREAAGRGDSVVGNSVGSSARGMGCGAADLSVSRMRRLSGRWATSCADRVSNEDAQTVIDARGERDECPHCVHPKHAALDFRGAGGVKEASAACVVQKRGQIEPRVLLARPDGGAVAAGVCLNSPERDAKRLMRLDEKALATYGGKAGGFWDAFTAKVKNGQFIR
jgi:hypothetical protein